MSKLIEGNVISDGEGMWVILGECPAKPGRYKVRSVDKNELGYYWTFEFKLMQGDFQLVDSDYHNLEK